MSQCDRFFDWNDAFFYMGKYCGYAIGRMRFAPTPCVFFDPAVNTADMQLGECDSPLHLTFPRHIFINNRLLIFLEALYLLLLDGY